jgi:uncharacterized RDD family membrane protein YckC
MFLDLQKASPSKRIAAYMLDFVLLILLAVGMGLLLSAVLDIDGYYQAMTQVQAKYEAQYQVSFDLTQAEYGAMAEAERALIDTAYTAFSQDPDAVYNYNMVLNLILVVLPLSLLCAYLVLEFAVPMLFGNGQTVGKKIFGIGVMRANGVKIDGVCLFARAILGKCTIETMVPVMLVMMVMWGVLGIVGPAVILLLGLLQIILLFATRARTVIHDCLANTVAVDLQSQMIFPSEAELIAYKNRLHEEKVNKSFY